MNTGLKRIEATLGQLNGEDSQRVDRLPDTGMAAQTASSAPSRIQAFPLPETPIARPELIAPPTNPAKPAQQGQPQRQPQSRTPNSKAAKSATKPARASRPQPDRAAKPSSVQTFPAQETSEAPLLPKSKPPSFSSHRHAVNPNLAVGLLREVESVVLGWQLSLEQTVLEIQALYLEGPIVDGWLESHPVGSPQVMQPVGTATLRHAEIDRLMEFVEEICRMPQPAGASEVARTGYRLCGLDADGALWSRPCPPQQVPYVGLAIARYQKLRILLARKQNLEARLNQLIQALTLLHGQMQE